MTTSAHRAEAGIDVRPPRPPRDRRAVAAATVGTVFEGFDFGLYGAFAVFLAPAVFFPATDPATGIIAGVSTFFVGFIARPIGGLVFGPIGDRLGRRTALIATLGLMGAATALIGLLPSYAAIGLAAPVALTVLRFVQGLALGGEWTGATLLAVESARSDSGTESRGRRGSAVAVGLAAGSALASLALVAVVSLGEAALLDWAWRVPFLIGGVLALAGTALRFAIREPAPLAALRTRGQVERTPVRAVWRHHRRTVALVAGSYIGGSTLFYGVVLFSQTYGTAVLGLSRAQLAPLLGVASLATIIGAVLAGWWGDRIGHQRVVLISLGACLAVLLPWLALMNSGDYLLILLAHVLTGVVTGLNFGLLGTLFSRCFPASVRYTGTGLAYNIGTVIGGSASLIATGLLASTGSVWPVLGYAAAIIVVSLFATRALRPLDEQVSA